MNPFIAVWDAATITVVGAVVGTLITGVIASIAVGMVKIILALGEVKVAMIRAAEERTKQTEKTAENSIKLAEIGKSTDGNLSAINERLDKALQTIAELHKDALAKMPPVALPNSEEPIKTISVNTPDNPAIVKPV